MKFCYVCGLAMVAEPAYGYNRDTGERLVRLVCPSGICGHDGIKHNFIVSNGMFKSTSTCIRCGKTGVSARWQL